MPHTTTLLGGALTVSVVGLGCNNLGRSHTATESQAGTDRVIHAAIDAGVTLFDVADMYGNPAGLSEERLGAALVGRRDDVVVATKFGHPRTDIAALRGLGPTGSRRYVERALDDSLRRLGTDRIDLYQIHFPDEQTRIEDTVEVLARAVAAGKVLHLGHSNFDAAQMRAAQHAASALGTRFISAQNEYSLLERGAEAEVLPEVRAEGMGLLPYFPLANGLLTGKYARDAHPSDGRLTVAKPQLLDAADWTTLERYRALCEDHGITMLQASIGWLLHQQGVASVIAGATRPEQIEQNVAAGDVAMSSELVSAIGALFKPAGNEH